MTTARSMAWLLLVLVPSSACVIDVKDPLDAEMFAEPLEGRDAIDLDEYDCPIIIECECADGEVEGQREVTEWVVDAVACDDQDGSAAPSCAVLCESQGWLP